MNFRQLLKAARKHGMTRKVGGDEHWHASLFLLVAGLAASQPETDESSLRGRAAMQALLNLAGRYGFTQVDDLRSRIERGDFGERTFVLAKAALWDVPGEDMNEALREAGFNPYLTGSSN